MIVTEYMENGSLDTFLRVSEGSIQLECTMDLNAPARQQRNAPLYVGTIIVLLLLWSIRGLWILPSITVDKLSVSGQWATEILSHDSFL